ncbi:MAG: hypothetical protein JST66_12375 [Bacteroidetes bacterium]|nr:hypothetical protein [Bacteroidota bacterium]
MITTLSADAQNVGISTDGAAPDLKSILDLNVGALASKRGMLIPRMSYAERIALGGSLTSADAGLWVYQNTDPPIYDPKNDRGFFYYDAASSSWVRVGIGRNGWSTSGNSNVNVPTLTQYLGTSGTAPIAGRDFILRSVNPPTPKPQLFIANSVSPLTGFTGLNNDAPLERLDVGGGVRIGSTVVTPATPEGTIVYGDNLATPAYNWHYGNTTGTPAGWKRMENAETLVPATPNNYPKDTLTCPAVPVAGSLVKGVSAGTTNTTPFPTNMPGAPITTKGFRAQYLYRGSELSTMGLCPGNITGIGFTLTANDLTTLQIDLEVRLANTTTNNFTAVPTATTCWIDTAASIKVFDGTPLLASGAFPINFSVPFNWTGGNLVIDVMWQRNTVIGNSPPVEVENTGISGFNPTKYYANTSNTAPNPVTTQHGKTIDDFPSPVPATSLFNILTTRPVTRFEGSVKATTYVNGTAPYVLYTQAIMLDSAANPADTWAGGAMNFRGPGTINARAGAFDGNTRLSDHVFDRYFDDRVKSEDQQAAADYRYVELPRLKAYLEAERHLPNMPSRKEWEQRGIRSLGELQTGLWETVETQALQITELEKDLSTLEALAFGKDLDPEALERMIAEVRSSPRLSEQQKLHLIDALHQRAGRQMPRK